MLYGNYITIKMFKLDYDRKNVRLCFATHEQSEKYLSSIIKTLLTLFWTKYLFLKLLLKLHSLPLQLERKEEKEVNEDKIQVNKCVFSRWHGYKF